jgi:DNA-binding SARP family transcriptional activator
MSVLHVFLFGKLRMRRGRLTLYGPDKPKVRGLFCYLLLYRDRPHPREYLASVLWDDTHTDQPNRNLRKTLWQLRTALDSQSDHLSERLLLVEPEWLQVNPEADLWLDVAAFEQAFNHVQGTPGKELDSRDVQALQGAVDLYQGGLQESWYQDWYLYERERFQHMYLIMLDKLMGYCEAHGDYEAGLAYGTRILRYERARERTHRRLMRLHYLAGDRTAALRQYLRCMQTLDEELGVRPAGRTATLYQQIRTDQLLTPPPMPVEATAAPKVVTFPLPEVLGRLKKLQAVLAEAQRQVKQGIQAVELPLKD